MAATTFLSFFIFLIISHIPESSSQQNIETFYPFSPPPIPSIVPPPPPPDLPISFPPPPGPEVPPPRRTSTKAAVGRAIGVTAASTVVLSALLLFLFVRYNSRRKREENPPAAAAAANGSAARGSFRRYGGNVKGLIVDENGLDVLYWRNMQEGESQIQAGYRKQNFKSLKEEQQEEEKRVVSERERERKSKPPVQELPLLRGKSSTSQSLIWAEEKHDQIIEKAPSFANGVAAVKVEKQLVQNNPPPPLPPPPRLSAPPPIVAVGAVAKKSPAPPPPPSPIPANKGPSPPPPPSSSTKPPPNKWSSSAGESSSEKVKLKPLHWDKVNPNVEHSMVWDKIDKGSFKFDGDLMEALFGSVAVNRRSPRGGDNNKPPSPLSNKSGPGPPSQIFLLDTRRSQNTAIVLKSLALSRKEIIDALNEGRGLSSDTIEKLAAIAPTSDEASQITAFDGDPTRLADAESFLYHLLKSVPTAFSRFHAMLFRSNYDSEVLSIQGFPQPLESACKNCH
ncbi:hypothetical protein SASPL_110571 [Salvia splendens]|uniref:FH2 domain-containing protein n=1 Tax=Salvia splendens TaxID=180675 RepID=A0A8X8Y7F7_SALSN|nr:formin-like protein 4 [Salvia splendens]KAG6426349.1 hypothetical protein SASPL_110571 [Salvia splendens]